MRRREFIKLGAGAAVAWPLMVRAQQPTTPVIGFLSSRSPDDTLDLVAAFRRGLADNGYIEGKTVAIEIQMGTWPIRPSPGHG